MKRLNQMLSFVTVIAVLLAVTFIVPASPPGKTKFEVTPIEKRVAPVASFGTCESTISADSASSQFVPISSLNNYGALRIAERQRNEESRTAEHGLTYLRDRYGPSISQDVALREPIFINAGFGLENRSRAKI